MPVVKDVDRIKGRVLVKRTTASNTFALKVALVVLGLVLVLATAASAAPIAPYDGSNPFRCKTQNVGTGVDYPDPGADPFCVEFDKTRQNVTDLGIVDFLLNEPARVAAATPKCFYHQTDHWTGSIVQGTAPVLWHWDGRYFFDKARGMGGVRIDNLVVGGLPADPRLLPGFPAEFSPYFGPGGGGAFLAETIPADPSCAARIDTPQEVKKIYRDGWRYPPSAL
jgi:hypothetical protein